MNPFRSRKKSVSEGEAKTGRPVLEDAPPIPSARGRTFRRKKPVPEPKPELKIELALPSTDDFRTSLLMPNLSARFSMLREQDDPNSKVGKASDDSVLFPRRQSRLGLFAPDGLSDIAEVSSLAGSIRPPFASGDRTHSYSSGADIGYGTDDDSSIHGSVMGRAKPGQGNKFFGGRQKIYKVPVSGGKDANGLGDDVNKPMGKALYDDDISMSTFQAMRATRKQERGSLDDDEHRSSRENEGRASPPLADYDRKRETSSSTNSGPPDGRTSTAATSVASQGAASSWYAAGSPMPNSKQSPVTTPGQERPGKGKRLYGQGLDQQMIDQQSSALNRLNSIQQRAHGFGASAGNGPGLSRSASNLNDRFQKAGHFSPASAQRSGSPSPSGGFNGFDFGVNGDGGSRSASIDREGRVRETRPMSPQGDPTLVAALEPNDVGKATASGFLNRPKAQYNEQQFAQRQLQLQEGRDTPPPRAFSRSDVYSDHSGRMRNGSLASVRSAQSSRNQFRADNGSRAASNASNGISHSPSADTQEASNGTYLADFSGSEYGSGASSPDLPTLAPTKYQKPGSSDNVARSTIYEHDDQHPAFRSQPHRLYLEPSDDEDEELQPTDLDALHRAKSSTEQQPKDGSFDVDSPTLGDPATDSSLDGGLTDLIKGHLRTDSDTSVYTSPGLDQESRWGAGPTNGTGGRPTSNDIPQPSAFANRARQVLEQATQLANANAKAHDVLGGVGADKVQQVLGGEAPRRSNDSARAPWQDQMKSHARGGSSATQKEREDFAIELADRRQRVQDSLRNIVDDTSSPVESHENSPARTGAFGLLKKASKGSPANRNDNPSKAGKMLGMSNANDLGGSSPNIHSEPYQSQSREGSRGPLSSQSREGSRGPLSSQSREGSRGPLSSHSREGSRGPLSRAPETNGRAGAGNGPSFRDRSIGDERREKFFRKSPSPSSNIERFNTAEPPPPPPAQFGFSRSRTDAANQPMSYHPAGRARKYSPPRPNTSAPTVDNLQEPRSRSNSALDQRTGLGRSAGGSYFPPQQRAASPTTANMYHSAMGAPRPPPGPPGFSAHATPPLEPTPHMQPTAPTPTMVSHNQPQNQANGRAGRPRKHSVAKDTISTPTFISATSSVPTMDLPAGASLSNGMSDVKPAPPLPPINPRRRKMPSTQDVFTAFSNKSANWGTQSQPSSAHPSSQQQSPFEERSTFSGDEEEQQKPSKPRSRLRKSSSDGGNMAARARHQALMKEMDQMPPSPGLQRF